MMQLHFFTTRNYIKSFFLSKLEFFLGQGWGVEKNDFDNFQFIDFLKDEGIKNKTRIGIYQAAGRQKVIIKHLTYKVKNLLYEQILNEASMLRILEPFHSESSNDIIVRFPKILDVISGKNNIALVREYIAGESLNNFPIEFKLKVIKEFLRLMLIISARLDKKVKKILPKRSNLLMIISFPIYVFRAIARDWRHAKYYFGGALIFGKFIRYFSIFYPNYVLAHRDLHLKNIIVNGKQAVVIDHELCVLAEAETEIAIIFCQCWREFGIATIIKFLQETFVSAEQKKKFAVLSVYYTVQFLTIQPKDAEVYHQLREYLEILLKKILPALGKEQQ